MVKIHNVHPVYLNGSLDGLGACLRTTIQVHRIPSTQLGIFAGVVIIILGIDGDNGNFGK